MATSSIQVTEGSGKYVASHSISEDSVTKEIQRVFTDHPSEWNTQANYSSAQTNTQLKAAPGASLSLYITDIVISNGATAGTVKLVEDPGGTPADKVPAIYCAVNGGAVMQFSTPIKLTANKALGITSVTVTTHSIVVNGFIAP